VEPEPDISPHHIGGFRVIRRLASGATTDVLLARAEGPHGFERVVALKVLLQQFRSDPAFERMFAREASAYARLSHPAIVKLYDFFSAEGQLVMVLEYVDGLPLHKLRAMLSIGGERLEDRAALFIGSRIFAALAAAHSARDPENGEFSPVIHRDINPSNVLVPWDGHVKISDFGIAKIGNTQGDTRLGFVKGTYGYMAPEQVRGEVVTVRADVYAATLLLWELLARRKAIQRGALPEVEVLKAMAKPEFPSLDTLRPDVAADIREAVRRGLEANPDRRAVTAEEMANILRKATKGDEGRAMLADSIARVRPPPTSEGLAVTQAHPTHPSLHDVLAAPPASDLNQTVAAPAAGRPADPVPSSRDPDATQPFNIQDLPDDSGAFKRAEVPQFRPSDAGASLARSDAQMKAEDLEDLIPSDGVDAPKSFSDLTLIEPRRPGQSDPPPTSPVSSEPGTVSPTTLSLPGSLPPAQAGRSPSLGVVRNEPGNGNPETLRFGPPPSGTKPPLVAAPPAPPAVAAPPSASRAPASPLPASPTGPPSSRRLDPPRPATRPPRPADSNKESPRPVPLPFTSLTGGPTPSESLATTAKVDAPSSSPTAGPGSPRERTLVSPGSRSSSSPVHAPDVGPTLLSSGTAAPEPSVRPVEPLPEKPAEVAVVEKPAMPLVASKAVADAPPTTQAAGSLVIPTVKVARSVVPSPAPSSARRKRSDWPIILGVIVVSALLGVAGVEVYVRSIESASPNGSVSPSAPPPPPASASSNAAHPGTSAPVSPRPSAPPPVASSKSAAVPSAESSAVPPPASASSPLAGKPPATPSASAVPAAAVATPAGTDPDAAAAGLGSIFTDPSQSGHRIFSEGRVLGESPGPIQVRCGTRSIQVGSAGTARDVSIPCGGSVLVIP
jgi:serine/threonine protein kinase